jgi:hypothetical protein
MSESQNWREIAERIKPQLLGMDVTGDELMWVMRYTWYFQNISGWAMSECVRMANAAYEAWGQDPTCTPEEIASSDAACLREAG